MVVFRRNSVDVLLAVLAPHDERRRIGGLKRQGEMGQYKRIGVSMLNPGRCIKRHPGREKHRLNDKKVP